MLLDLPAEVILKVTNHLVFKDKINLMRTCHYLSSLVLENNLYSDLIITNTSQNHNNLENIIKKFASKKLNGAQVRKLAFDLNGLSDQLYNQLSTIFPNVGRLINFSGNGLKPRPYLSPLFLKWKDSFEHYDTLDGHFQIPYLLERNLFSRLSYLCISPFFEYEHRLNNSSIRIIECIKNAPSLRHLTLQRCMINISFLEIVHSSCPKLNSLILEDALVATSDDTLPRQCISASTMIHLDISKSTLVCDINCIFLDYIITKYPNLEQLSYLSTFNQSLLDKFFPNDPEERQNNTGIFLNLYGDLDITPRIYLREGSRLLSRLPESLKTLKIHAHIFENVIESLWKSEINPEKIIFFEHNHYAEVFQQPEDLHYLQKWTSLNDMEVAISDVLEEWDIGDVSIHLKRLYLTIEGDLPEKKTNLARLLDMFPSLEELCIRYSGAMLVGDEINQRYYKLRKIDLGHSYTDTSVLKFLAHAAPNLKELCYYIFGNAIKKSIEKERVAKPICITPNEPLDKHYKMDLSDFHLEKLQLWIQLGDVSLDINCNVFFEIATKRKVRQFVFSEGFRHVSVVKNKEGSENMAKITVWCDNINQIRINHAICIDLKEEKLCLSHI